MASFNPMRLNHIKCFNHLLSLVFYKIGSPNDEENPKKKKKKPTHKLKRPKYKIEKN